MVRVVRVVIIFMNGIKFISRICMFRAGMCEGGEGGEGGEDDIAYLKCFLRQ